jgi:hypothetical protein
MELFGFPQDRYTPEPEGDTCAGGNVFLRRMYFRKAGCTERGHAHTYSHMTFLERGKIGLEVSGRQSIHVAPCGIKITASDIHTLVALEDDTVAYCIHALRDKDAETIFSFGEIPFEDDPLPHAAPLTQAPKR